MNRLLHFFCYCSILCVLTTASPLPSSVSGNTTQQWSFPDVPSSKSLVWYPCYNTFFCAVLDVPLDYLKPLNGERAFIPLVKYPATTPPYKGMLLTNPGGPGGSGVGFVTQQYPSLVSVTGSNYDLVSWDPRGVGLSLPAINCTDMPVYIYPDSAFNGRSLPKLDFPQMLENDFEVQYQIAQQEGQACENDLASAHLTTATTARDMISILDAFAETEDGKRAINPSLANYWGFSYGTVLGQTFASMFPNRLGHFVLDGVLDPDDYVSGLELRQVLLTDDVFSTFFLYCNKAGPALCPFFTGSTPEDIYLRLEALIGQLNVTYAESQGWANASILDFSMEYVSSALFGNTYRPITDFPPLAESLVNLESVIANNLTQDSLISWVIQSQPSSPPQVVNEPIQPVGGTAIHCGDTRGSLFNITFQDYYGSIIQKLESQSSLAGGLLAATSDIACTGWPIVSDDTFTGPFGGSTNSPILFVSNTLDPITPIFGGEKGARIFHGAELLTTEGIGHTSLATLNQCAFAKINRFFQTGALPGNDNYCPLEAGPWNITLTGPLNKRDDVAEIRAKLGNLQKRR